jgi:peptidoglycan DL-endopeptidase CwlO
MAATVAALTLVLAPATALADQFDDQIAALKVQAAANQAQANAAAAQASTYQAEVDRLNAQAAGIRSLIRVNQLKYQQTQARIADNEAQLNQQKQVLGANIKQMYLDSSTTPLEALVGSNSLSDYFDKQEYQDKVKDKIQSAMASIQQLQEQLKKESDQLSHILTDEKNQEAQVATLQQQAQALVNQYAGQEASYEANVRQQNAQMSSLRAQQAAAMAARFGGAPGNGPACGGGYPGKWCNIPQDSAVDSWGMYNRECVSYTAWRESVEGNYVPYGMGNANQWPAAAQRAGIPTGSTPRAGSVAIWYIGSYGHAMYVEEVYGDGSFLVSQYNYGENGTYSTMRVGANSGFTFIYF